MKWPSFYFSWLQKGNPTGRVERYPELKKSFETSVSGLYCIGDLTGVPLINLAAASGQKIVSQLKNDEVFQKQRQTQKESVLDIIIIGAGPAGVAAGIEAKAAGLSFSIIEATRPFTTIHNFPKGKPIHIIEQENAKSAFTFEGDTRESLLKELKQTTQKAALPIVENQSVHTITKKEHIFTVKAKSKNWNALRVVIAIGKSGNPRQLGVPGENAPKVFSRLIDSTQYQDKQIMVVGGGDSALEAAIALANAGNRVTISYRGKQFSRPKAANVLALQKLEKTNQISVILNSQVTRIEPDAVFLQTGQGDSPNDPAKEQKIPNHVVFSLIGTEIPIAFFERANVKIENTKDRYDILVLVALLLFSCVLYFGKSGPVTQIQSPTDFFSIPSQLLQLPAHKMIKGMMAWSAFIGLIGAVITVIVSQVIKRRLFTDKWNTFKWFYFAAMCALFGGLYIRCNLQGGTLLTLNASAWYTAMYSLTILIFGLRRMHMKPTPYIKKQTWTLIGVQMVPLFILPLFVLPWMGENGLLGNWVMTHIFPGESYWRAFGFILGWPLFLYNLASGQPYVFWLVYSLIQTFVIIPFIVYKWGKGAYCGWICSCGALAETLGDEYRTLAPHGPTAKKWENAGQIVLWAAMLITAFAILRTWAGISVPGTTAMMRTYGIIVDIIFAGVLGVGVYFTYSGRVWCRFLCPLAALMHLYARFSIYRIFANKNRCISCGICTKVCHMGIDVMGFAASGTPMNDVECVRCSACIVNCPMDVLSFGAQSKSHK